jgi:hypothetical protein
MRLRNKIYVWTKIAKANTPALRRARLLKTADPASSYAGRVVLGEQEGNAFLLERLRAGIPFSAGKIGDTELEVLIKFDRYRGDPTSFFRSVTAEGHEFDLLQLNCGVFPKDEDVLIRWAEVYLEAVSTLDLIGVWFNAGEEQIIAKYAPHADLARIRALEPYYHALPWTASLGGKRVAVVSPFEKSIAWQRSHWTGRDLFPERPAVLPDFELIVVRAPFSAGLVSPEHSDWHEALSDMKQRLSAANFDACLVGAGAYSLPICGFVRHELKRPAIHLGGPLQILFGIRGNRWDHHPTIKQWFNEKWIRPLPGETPRRNWKNDGGAYW